MKNYKTPLILAALCLAFAAYFALDLGQYLSLAAIKTQQARFAALYAAQPVAVMAGYVAVYVAATALSLPGATLLTLLAGALFGLGWGVMLVSVASTIGATLAMLVSRTLLRDVVQRRFGTRLAGINAGLAKDGAFYLFTLRVLPIVPFFALNLLMGLTHIRTFTYAWVSQLGMLAATVVYVNAGQQLGGLDSLAGIATPAVLGSFALLGALPFVAKWLIALWQKRRIYAPWAGQKPRQFDANIIVIGAGAGGLVSAYIAAAVKARVVLIEAHKMGGDCLNYGCVPSKALIKSASVAHTMRHADRYGLATILPTKPPEFSFKAVMQRVHAIIAAIAPHDSVARYTALGVDVVQGHATLVNPWTVQVKGADSSVRQITARSIIIAAGAAPIVPKLVGLLDVGYLTSDTLWDAFAKLDAPPKRLVVLGGGPIGCELAQAFARLGSSVSVVEMGARILPREDADAAAVVAQSMADDGVCLLTGHTALRCGVVIGEKTITLSHNGAEMTLAFDALVVAVGRAPRLAGYGLETLGIHAARTIQTNEYLQTLYPNIYAAGDVAGPYQFTHVAAHQAWYAAVNALFGTFKRFKVDYRVIPSATFTAPELARVGLNEQDATAQGVAFELTRYGIDDLDRAIADSAALGFVKVLTVPGKDTILGVTIVGAGAAELLAEYVLAMKHGLGLNKILGTIHTYPTMAEANKYAAGEWKRAHQPHSLLRWVAKYHAWRRA